MKFLVVEDDLTSRKIMTKMLTPYGECDMVINGVEAVEAFILGWEDKEPYDMLFLDIMLPEMDGQEALKEIRKLEGGYGVKPKNEVPVVMTTALNSPKDVMEAYYRGGCSDYLVKPIDKEKLIDILIEYLDI